MLSFLSTSDKTLCWIFPRNKNPATLALSKIAVHLLVFIHQHLRWPLTLTVESECRCLLDGLLGKPVPIPLETMDQDMISVKIDIDARYHFHFFLKSLWRWWETFLFIEAEMVCLIGNNILWNSHVKLQTSSSKALYWKKQNQEGSAEA